VAAVGDFYRNPYVWIAGTVQKLPISNRFRPVVDSDLNEISCKIAVTFCGMLIAEFRADCHETAGVQPKL
jgi:hypothetical protein